MSQEKPGFSTLCVHGGEDLDAQGGIHVPLYNHSTFGFPSTQALLDVVEGRKEGNLYTRYGLNPTIRAVERKLALRIFLHLSWHLSTVRKKGLARFTRKPLIFLAPRAGFEPATGWLTATCSTD